MKFVPKEFWSNVNGPKAFWTQKKETWPNRNLSQRKIDPRNSIPRKCCPTEIWPKYFGQISSYSNAGAYLSPWLLLSSFYLGCEDGTLLQKEICPKRNPPQGKFGPRKFDPLEIWPNRNLTQQKFDPIEIWPKKIWSKVNWPKVNWPKVNWPKVNWPKVNWPKVNWPKETWPNAPFQPKSTKFKWKFSAGSQQSLSTL